MNLSLSTSLSPSAARRAVLVASALSTTLVLGACGASAPTSTARTSTAPGGGVTSTEASVGPRADGPHNSSDVSFATGMVPHHSQAVQMAALALSTSSNPRVLALATAIKGSQDPEITTLQGWLRDWAAPASGSGHDRSAMPGGTPMPAPHGSAMPGMTMPGMTMPGMTGTGMTGTGMMNDGQMRSLSGATGAGFDRLWLTMMTEHHTGAIQMARTELADGLNPGAKQLAGQIIAAQSAELATMATLVGTLSSS